MPEIDVTEVLLDSDIAGESFVVIRRTELVNIFGERTNPYGNKRELAIGSVTPTGENSLVREEGFQTQTKTIKVITPTLLRGTAKYAGQKFDPDIVLWRGDYYVVRTVEDYSQYGVGMIEAECSSTDYVEQPPMNP